MITTAQIQKALIARGHDLGPSGADGVNGRLTTRALKAFQRGRGIAQSGVADRATLGQLFPDKPNLQLQAKPPWDVEAKRLMGVKEIAGARSNPTILGWAQRSGGWVASFFKNDDTPWCGLFVGHCIGLTLPDEPLPSNPLSALAWGKFGRGLTIPAPGAVCVFKRAGGGHVGFYAGEDREAIHVRGGNQSNAVTVARVARSRLVGFRWPSTVPLPQAGVVAQAAGGALSKNEA